MRACTQHRHVSDPLFSVFDANMLLGEPILLTTLLGAVPALSGTWLVS